MPTTYQQLEKDFNERVRQIMRLSDENKRLSAENRSIKEAARWVCRDASYNEENDICEISVPPLDNCL